MTAIQVDPEGLGTSGQSIEGVATRFAEALAAFKAELAGFGQPWGSDDIGSLIGVAHDEVSSWAFECFDSAVEEIAAAGADLSLMGKAYAQVEDGIRSGFDGLRQALGG